MRGHIGFKIPPEPLPSARVTQLTTDVLSAQWSYYEDIVAYITKLNVDVLHNSAAANQPAARLTQITVDVLTSSNE